MTALTGIEAEITARLGDPPGSLAGFIASLDLGDAAAVASAARELETISGRLGVLASTFRDGMAFGEATLVHLDLTGIRQAVEAIRGEIRGADLAPLERTLAARWPGGCPGWPRSIWAARRSAASNSC